MLTEGWDANTVTHILGVRAFGTQLLCEQVIGRALRRQSYDLNEDGLFDVEYADVLGIPFDFNAKPVVAPPKPPRETVQVKAVRPERDALEIRFPRVIRLSVELPEELLSAEFNSDSVLELTPELVGAPAPATPGIIGGPEDLTREHPATSAPRDRLPARPPTCSTQQVARHQRASPGSPCSGSSSASPASGWTAIWSARAAPSPPRLYQDARRHGLQRITAGITRAFIGQA
jgi:type III restriction enzyme